ncbi:MAG: endonuclease VIII [Gammaproteobacteria bacterium]|nr:endonuclease VIII [Gammaproteobacteria bacterium]
MPEGPEIRRAADDLERALRLAPIDTVFFAFDQLRPFAERLHGRSVTAVDTRGKAMLIRFDNRLSIYSHNQLYGRWYVRKANSYPRTGRQLRLALHNAHKSALLYSASDIAVLTPAEVRAHPFLTRLGPDVLASDGDAILAQITRSEFRGRRLAALLLDQRFVAGVGNYLRSEILFVARLHPQYRPGDCSPAQLQALADAAVSVAQQSYRHRGVTNDLGDARRRKALGEPFAAYRHWVFARAGRPCRVCGGPIVQDTASSRRIYHCPVCQPVGMPAGRNRRKL